MVFKVDGTWDGRLLRDYIRSGCGVSRNTLSKLKTIENGILLNGKSVTVRAVVKEDDIVELSIEDSEKDENPYVVPAGEMPPIIYEDDAVIAVNKPYGMPTHTSFGHYEDALSNAVCLYLKKQNLPFVFRAVNRLDADTSGIVLIAKNRYYANFLSKALEKGEFSKTYIAVADGITQPECVIEGYISREGESIIKRRFSYEAVPNSDYSLTKLKTVYSNETASLIELTPVTGRTHQLRVHTAAIGHALIGDTMYGVPSETITRQALHAYSLSFPSPIDGERITVKAPIPKDLIELIKELTLDEGLKWI